MTLFLSLILALIVAFVIARETRLASKEAAREKELQTVKNDLEPLYSHLNKENKDKISNCVSEFAKKMVDQLGDSFTYSMNWAYEQGTKEGNPEKRAKKITVEFKYAGITIVSTSFIQRWEYAFNELTLIDTFNLVETKIEEMRNTILPSEGKKKSSK